MKYHLSMLVAFVVLLAFFFRGSEALSFEPTDDASASPAETVDASASPAETVDFPPASTDAEEAEEEPNESIVRVAREWDVWIDQERKLVIVDGKVCLREGALEMFACTPGTKEHESIIVVDSMAFLLHAALLAVGAEQGHPVLYDPVYVAATGTEIEIIILWTDEEGNRHQDRAQDWILNTRTEKAMEYPFVFAGSRFWVDEITGERSYHAEGGDLICVSNFSTAMLDVPVASSAENAGLLFACFTEAIPPVDTEVRVLLIPKLNEEDSSEEEEPQE